MPGATLAGSAARVGERGSAFGPAPARTLALEAGPDKRRVTLELDRGRAYRVVAGDRARSHIIDQLASTGYAALIPAEGGLIGNLKIWENLVLPLAWQGERNFTAAEARARAILGAFGFGGERFAALCHALPERLSLFECRVLAFTRAMLIEPEVMVYDRAFEGLTHSQAEQACTFDAVFHAYFPFRTSIYLESDTEQQVLVPVHVEYDLREYDLR